MNRISRFYRISAPAPAREMDEAARDKYYRRLRMQAFIAATLGYSLYYVCRTSLNVMKKPILDSGSLDASQLGVIGSALLFAYAIGKFVNGFIADYCNIKRFMATGLIVSAAANMLMGVLGLMHSVIPTAVIFIAFAVMWGLNGWSQSMGAAPAIISLSRWYPLKERGTYYGLPLFTFLRPQRQSRLTGPSFRPYGLRITAPASRAGNRRSCSSRRA